MMRSRGRGSNQNHRVFSPNRRHYVFAKGHNLFLMELPEDYKPDEDDEADASEGDKDDKDDKDDSQSEGGEKRTDKNKDTDQENEKDQEKNDDDKKEDKKEDKQVEQEQGENSGTKQDDLKDGGSQGSDGKDGGSRKQKSDETQSDEDQTDEDQTDKVDSGDKGTTENDQGQTTDSKKQDQDEKKSEKGSGDKNEQQEDKREEQEKGKDEQQEDEQVKKEQDDDREQDQDKEQNEEQEQDQDQDEDDDAESAEDESDELPIPKVSSRMDRKATQISDDGEEKYSFAGRSRSRGGSRGSRISEDQKTRPNVRWNEDSTAFYVTRRDSRDVPELWVINSLASPRPTLESYSYAMPGDEHVVTTELYYYSLANEKLTLVEPKWKDESYVEIRWSGDNQQLQFIRRDRTLRNIELCSLDLATGEIHCLLEDGFENAYYVPARPRYLEESDELIWWSERSGWAHFYLYDLEGNLKNPITSGEFRASSIVKIDEENRVLYFRGNAREEGENVYFDHLYRVRFDGSNLKLMDPGNANHRSTLSPTNEFSVDNCSRVDMPPQFQLRDADGQLVMDLEKCDTSRLEQVGWQPPETFVVKAADGVTDLYGNMWKPFDFDPRKKYPIIAHVYPGPQQEGTRHSFSATAGEQQLAQLGFIVIQCGHRGGAPTRSKSYSAYGYSNLRDYGLADKKATIEQLSQRFPFIDIERVGIYGHSGGGFMTAAALLREPYNDFFKVGVSTAGNHDNNIYNNSWSERYHGLTVKKKESDKSRGRGNRGSGGQQGEKRDQDQDQEKEKDEKQDDSSLPNRNGVYDVSPGDHFYEFELLGDGTEMDQFLLEQMSSSDQQIFESSPDLHGWLADNQEDVQEKKQQDEQGKDEDKGKDDVKDEVTDEDKDKDKEQEQDKEDKELDEQSKNEEQKKDEKDGQEDDKSDKDDEKSDDKSKEEKEDKFAGVEFEIEIPTNAELAENLKGHLFLIHGELDNNVHPANTLRLVDALIKANKRFDMLYLPATRHGFGQYQPYVTQRMYEYFAEHLLDDYQAGPDIREKE